jgi:hypothetical protein
MMEKMQMLWQNNVGKYTFEVTENISSDRSKIWQQDVIPG